MCRIPDSAGRRSSLKATDVKPVASGKPSSNSNYLRLRCFVSRFESPDFRVISDVTTTLPQNKWCKNSTI